jgi:hypothetical protein
MVQKKPYHLHFPYKHPTFGTVKTPKPKAAWESSVYYWWWAYLKKNTEYIKCCEKDGTGALAKLYADFGDVRGDSFKAWWTDKSGHKLERGARLFAQARAEDSIRTLEEGEAAVSNVVALTVSLPLNLPKKLLLRRFKEFLDVAHKGKRGKQLAKEGGGKYQFKGQPNIPALRLGLQVYEFKQANPNMKLWEIGNSMPNFQMEQKIMTSDTPSQIVDKKNVLAASVSRYLRRVSEAINNTGKGEFL